MKVIRDAVHGDIELFPNEMRLIHTAAFQRLHGCRQLGLTHLVYPSAKHSRFEHVLGVMHMATQIADRLTWLPEYAKHVMGASQIRSNGRRGRPISSRQFFAGIRGDRLRKILRLAALLHDMGHVPFGHTLKDEMPVIAKHDEPSVPGTYSRMDSEVSRALKDSGNEAYREEVLQTLRAISVSKEDDEIYSLMDKGEIRQELVVLADIIGNTICADLLDYIKRDYMMTGVRATYDDRLLRYFSVGKHRHNDRSYDRLLIGLVRHGRVRGDCLADLLDLLKLRYNLSDKVLFHPKKCAASAMLIRAVHDLGLTAKDLMATSDDGLLENHASHPLISMLRRRQLFKPVHVSRLEHVTSYHHHMKKKDLLGALRENHSLRHGIEEIIERKLKLPRHTVLVYCPKPDMTLKPVRVLVQWKDGTTRRLNELENSDDALTFKQVSTLQRIHPELWRLYLFVDPKFRNGGHRIRDEFVKALKQKAHLSVTCDPAFDQYLETGCPDYMLGRHLDDLMGENEAYQDMSNRQRAATWRDCHAHERLSSMAGDDEYEDLEVETLASRLNTRGMHHRLEDIIESAIANKASRNKRKVRS